MERDSVEFQPFLPALYPDIPRHIKNGNQELPEESLEKLADLVTSGVKDLPINPAKLAQYFGIMQIVEVKDLWHAQGLLEDLPKVSGQDYFRALISQDDSDYEKKVTIVHEMGHVALRKLGLSTTGQLEELCDRFVRMVFAPRRFMSEYSSLDYYPLDLFKVVFKKTQMHPGYLAKRLVEDLGLIKDTIIVGRFESQITGQRSLHGGWVGSKDIFSEIKDYSYGSGHFNGAWTRIWDWLAKFRYPSEVYHLENIYALYHNGQNIDLYILKGEGIALDGKETLPEFAVLRLKAGDKVAEITDLKYLDPRILSRSLLINVAK